ncbi:MULTISPECIES: tyrosine-type recombinase/integrase [unclassified Acinetobacter]|uniref:tyrosine-type recombinase/integrase n=1 Tax=unclassified Acinetobacter TaxID=196816 RepID=UPI00190A1E00|nr:MULTISPECIES: tyrosine-type recombinase/integrase [unclassified Acinetobacter]MBK0062587.1 tyrosine-type recombinase/integrase [Acinetobacter sp. S55]MBK0065836.1 tyrosine-type recombinase/integrase [Acinetobacter sp. S54]
MSAGLEIRKKSMRIWIRDGELIKEPLDYELTDENIVRAKQLVELIKLELKLGKFDLAKHFPDSRNIKTNTMSYYINRWLDQIESEIAPSTFDAYKSQVKCHVRPKWGKLPPSEINTNDVKKWANGLKRDLAPKTVREIVTRLSQIHSIWRNEHKIAFDPMRDINIHQMDPCEPDPFSKSEINAILSTDSHPDLTNFLPCLIWTGFSISEQLPIAWEDIDLNTGMIQIRRSYVRGVYRVTKNRRRNRRIKLLQPALEALRRQYKYTANCRGQTISILQRDNVTYKQERLRFVWINTELSTHFEYYTLRYLWRKHLSKAKIRYRGPNQGRHTFASQLLSSGQVPPEWIAEQLGHSDTSMIYRHYGKLIAEDLPDYAGRINLYIAS